MSVVNPNVRKFFDMLGYPVVDKVTGMKGVAESLCFDLYGCVQIGIRPPCSDKGEIPPAHWYDVSRVSRTAIERTMEPVVDFAGAAVPSVPPGPADKAPR